MRLPRKFYIGDNVVSIARDLLGKVLCTNIDGQLTSGMIVETEAYRGPEDKASHAYGGRRTARTEIMYGYGGTAYIYLCYGIHHLFNVVTAVKDIPHAILIRGIEPCDGIDKMLERRNMSTFHPRLTAGPGALSVAMGLDLNLNGSDLVSKDSLVWIEDRDIQVVTKNIVASPRVGVEYAAEDAARPWRFRIRDNQWASRAK